MAKAHVLTRTAAATHGALSVYLLPKLAKDAKIDLNPILANLTPKNFAASKPKIAADLKAATAGKLAKDATLDDVTNLLDQLENVEMVEGKDDQGMSGSEQLGSGDPSKSTTAVDPSAVDEGSVVEQIKALLAKCSPEDRKALGMDAEEDEDAKKKREAEEKAASEKEKQAMDGKIKTAVDEAVTRVKAEQAAIRDAFNEVEPIVGKIHIAADSAEGVFKAVLEMKGVDVKGVHPSAFRAMVGMLPKAGDEPQPKPALIAQDAAGHASFNEMFPGATRIN